MPNLITGVGILLVMVIGGILVGVGKEYHHPNILGAGVIILVALITLGWLHGLIKAMKKGK